MAFVFTKALRAKWMAAKPWRGDLGLVWAMGDREAPWALWVLGWCLYHPSGGQTWVQQ